LTILVSIISSERVFNNLDNIISLANYGIEFLHFNHILDYGAAIKVILLTGIRSQLFDQVLQHLVLLGFDLLGNGALEVLIVNAQELVQ
jgi:hypothetical protein